jgi:hypothetical protein
MIVKRAGKYVVVSETTGRRFGSYDALAEAKRRLRQIEFFKQLRTRTPARGRWRASTVVENSELARSYRRRSLGGRSSIRQIHSR